MTCSIFMGNNILILQSVDISHFHKKITYWEISSAQSEVR